MCVCVANYSVGWGREVLVGGCEQQCPLRPLLCCPPFLSRAQGMTLTLKTGETLEVKGEDIKYV